MATVSLAGAVIASLPAVETYADNWKPAEDELTGQPMTDPVLKSINLKLDNGK
jgi:hypothetical protein